MVRIGGSRRRHEIGHDSDFMRPDSVILTSDLLRTWTLAKVKRRGRLMPSLTPS